MVDIVARAKGLILQPRQEWQVIAAEPADTGGLFTGYAVPMAAIPAVAGFIGSALLGSWLGSVLPGVPRPGVISLLLNSIAGYILGLVAVWVLGKIVQLLAPRFGGTADETGAMKLAVYSSTASWLAGVFAIFPPLAILGLLGLYSLYIFYKGAPVVMRVPEDKAMVFTILVLVCAVVLAILVGLVAGVFLSF